MLGVNHNSNAATSAQLEDDKALSYLNLGKLAAAEGKLIEAAQHLSLIPLKYYVENPQGKQINNQVNPYYLTISTVYKNLCAAGKEFATSIQLDKLETIDACTDAINHLTQTNLALEGLIVRGQEEQTLLAELTSCFDVTSRAIELKKIALSNLQKIPLIFSKRIKVFEQLEERFEPLMLELYYELQIAINRVIAHFPNQNEFTKMAATLSKFEVTLQNKAKDFIAKKACDLSLQGYTVSKNKWNKINNTIKLSVSTYPNLIIHNNDTLEAISNAIANNLSPLYSKKTRLKIFVSSELHIKSLFKTTAPTEINIAITNALESLSSSSCAPDYNYLDNYNITP